MTRASHRSAFILSPLSLLEHRSLSPLARMVWIRLMGHRNRDNGKCNPTHSKLAEELSVSVHRIRRAIRELRCGRLLSGTNKCGRGNWYTLYEPGAIPQAAETVTNVTTPLDTAPVCQCKDARSASARMHGLPVQECAGTASASLYEPDVFNQMG